MSGWIVVLNGAPRSGKSSIARAMQDTLEGPWMNLGVDAWVREVTPARLRPGIGLRPGGERPDLEPLLPAMFEALYESAAAHSRRNLHVVMDVGHHEGYSRPLELLPRCARCLIGLPAVLVGVRCPLETVLRRRQVEQPGREGEYVRPSEADPVPAPIVRWQEAVHVPGIYDLEVDTSVLSPTQCAARIGELLAHGVPRPSAFERLAGIPS